MRSVVLIIGIVAAQAQAAVVLDRIAAIAGKHAIKLSDIERDLRITEFQNRTPLDLSAAAKKKSADRLIDQAIIRDEIATGDYDRASDADAANAVAQIRRDRYAGSDPGLRAALAKYGVTEDELKDELLWQLTVLRFIDERFRPAVMVQPGDVNAYYTAHLTELKREYPGNNSLAALTPKIESLLEGQDVDKQFDAWLDDARKNQRVEYREEALR